MPTLITLFLKFSAFSLIAFGGVNALLPVLLELAVYQEHWLDLQTFSDYFAIAQAAPGPNFMTVTLIGWHISGILGAFMATFAIIWPAGILVFFLQRFILKMQDPMRKKTVHYAAATLAIGLVLSSAIEISLQINHGTMAFLLSGITIAIVLLTRWHPLYLIGLGALLGACGLI
ncbi:chromate transporter [Polynucleobacter paneuropaeus]|uniref:Chromate transporter n=1 Tax=Polynucleobacter paneuropaeus TaxID=2527775 RepID=A0A2Z4JR12_9BURK|nr:chromate transporter [Polynucleobacter paneuropaeus]AWW44851.1 chromate transporter [Polynucleobacter paneuropaeus]AWW49295.1 chromate transporter [Polynucleobacter paneuropaeus]MBT8517908.1 chromate transporter [Polynucleobacter paneuropaeus]MBT8525209.1 chromate transporter [Polynucleobacter paneuropaeus]MBT8531812.1 chromate transporter [Polynucleobacter paneuropaeus]